RSLNVAGRQQAGGEIFREAFSLIPQPISWKSDYSCLDLVSPYTVRLGSMPFIHLHARSHFSFLSGLPSPEALADRAAALKMPAVALTDTNRVSGLILFYKACRAKGIKPLLGIEL